MRRLHPDTEGELDADVLVAHEHRPAPADRPWVLLNMVVSADGATSSHGRSGVLGGAADRRLFHALRGIADVVVAGAGTVRAEHYGPPRATEEVQARRRERGQTPLPRLGVISASLDLDVTDPFFVEAATPPLVITTFDAPDERCDVLRPVAELLTAGHVTVDLADALAQLRLRGAQTVLVEGGPTVNGQLVDAGLVDELCLTISPHLVGGTSRRLAVGTGEGLLERFHLDRVLRDDDHLFLRYVRGSAHATESAV